MPEPLDRLIEQLKANPGSTLVLDNDCFSVQAPGYYDVPEEDPDALRQRGATRHGDANSPTEAAADLAQHEPVGHGQLRREQRAGLAALLAQLTRAARPLDREASETAANR